MSAGFAAQPPRACPRLSACDLGHTASWDGVRTPSPSTRGPLLRTPARRSASYGSPVGVFNSPPDAFSILRLTILTRFTVRFVRTRHDRPRKCYPKCAAPADRRLDAQMTPTDLDGPSGDRQPESTAAYTRRTEAVGAVVTIENQTAKLLGYARSVVDHVDLRRSRRLRQADANHPTGRRVFDR